MRQIFKVFIVLFSTVCYTEEEVNLLSEKKTALNILNKEWSCTMRDSMAGDLGVWSFKYTGGKYLTGSINIPKYELCNSDQLKGKIKGNLLTYSASTKGFCNSVIGNFKFYRNDDGVIKAKGHYTYGGTRKTGTYECSSVDE